MSGSPPLTARAQKVRVDAGRGGGGKGPGVDGSGLRAEPTDAWHSLSLGEGVFFYCFLFFSF